MTAYKMKFDTKNLKRRRVFKFFINASVQIAKTEGIENITIGKVANLAGYNNASFYNYFDNIEQLIVFTVISCISDYISKLAHILYNQTDPLQCVIDVWESYCMHSFTEPSIYSYAYASDTQTMDNIHLHMKDYCEIFPEVFTPALRKNKDKGNHEILPALLATTSEQHDKLVIEPCVRAGLLSEENAKEITAYGILLHHGLLYDALLQDNTKTPEELTATFFKYFMPFVQSKIMTNK